MTAKAHYDLSVDEASGKSAELLRLRGFRLRNKAVVLRALEFWADNPKLGFVDALTASYALQPETQLATFDSDFNRFPTITRWQPDDSTC